MNLGTFITLFKLIDESGVVSPKRPTFKDRWKPKEKDERGVTPPSKELPDLGLLHYFK
jgi:hypothetical protein